MKKSGPVTAFSELGDAYRELSAKGVKAEFLGYDQNSLDTTILVLVSDGKEVESIEEGMEVELVTKKTPFYGESGGQAGDTGTITTSNNDHAFLMEVTDTIKDPTGLIIHKGMVISGKIQRGMKVTLSVDMGKRNATASNHTATHILHHALRKVLGEHVKQAGSLVAPDRFRFDFTHFSQVGPDLLDEIESIVNQRIRDNVPVQTEEMDAEDAFKSGATALFEEKYGDRVRVVSLADFSMELCGGTHTKQTGNIGMFKIISESSIASGVRRIEALTGGAA